MTAGLIVLNTLPFALTCNGHLQVHEAVLQRFGFSHMILSPLTFLTAMFPHGSAMRPGSRLERVGEYDGAVRLYYRMCEVFPICPDIGRPCLRVARLMGRTSGDRAQARCCYAKMLELFPKGAMCLEAGGGLRRLPAPAG